MAAGCPSAISLARFGPLTTATWAAGTSATSAMTSLIRLSVPSSTPFIRLTSTAPGASEPATAARFSRRLCDGTASTTKSAPATASRASDVADSRSGSTTPGR